MLIPYDVAEGDVITFGSVRGEATNWIVIQVNPESVVMITEGIIDTITGYPTSDPNSAVRAIDEYMQDFTENKEKFEMTAQERQLIIKNPWIMSKSEVFGGDETPSGVFVDPVDSPYNHFKTRSNRGVAKFASLPHTYDNTRNGLYWATRTVYEPSANNIVNVSTNGGIFAYSSVNTIGLRPAIEVYRRGLILSPNYANEDEEVILRVGDANAAAGSVLASTDAMGEGTIQYQISGNTNVLEFIEDAGDNKKGIIQAKTDLQEGTYTLTITASDKDGAFPARTLNVKVLKGYPTNSNVEFTPEQNIGINVASGDTLGTASLDGSTDLDALKAAYQVDDIQFSIENASNASLTMGQTSGILTFTGNKLDAGVHTFDLVVTLVDGTNTITLKKTGCSILVDANFNAVFQGVSDPLVYGNTYTKAGNKIGTLTLDTIPISSVTSFTILSGGQGSFFEIKNKNELYVKTDVDAGTYTIQLEVIASGITKQKTITIEIEKASATLSFVDTTKMEIKIGDSTSTGTIQTNNTDTLQASDITYSLQNGISGVLSVQADAGDPKTYQLQVAQAHAGTGLPTTYQLQAALKETKNYKAATTTIGREILVYKELSALTWTAKQNIFSADDVKQAGAIMGTLLAKDGIEPYTYEIVAQADAKYDPLLGKDNGSFTIQNAVQNKDGKAEVTTTAILTPNTYAIQMKVTDDKGDVQYVAASIQVKAKIQAALEFKDKPNGNSITSIGQTVAYNELNASLLAEGGSTSAPIVYDYAPQSMQNGKNPEDYVDINKGSGALTPKQVGTIKVMATRPGDASYDEISTYMDVTIEPAKQSISFLNTTTPRSVALGKSVNEEARGYITLSNDAGVGGITYTSSDASIASIDAKGIVTGHKKGDVTITATLNKPGTKEYNKNYETIECKKNIRVYDGMGVSFTQKSNLQAGTASTAMNAPAGDVIVTGGNGTISHEISKTVTNANKDASLFQVSASGVVSFQKAIKAADIASSYDSTRKLYVLYVQVETADSANDIVTTDLEIELKGEALNAEFDTDGTGKITEEYGFQKTFIVSLSVNPGGGTPVYKLKQDANMPNDVLQSVASSGLVTIAHANDRKGNPNPVMIEASIPPANGYEGEIIEVEVEITKAEQPNFAFKNKKMKMSYHSLLTPAFQGKLSSGGILLTSGNQALITIQGDDLQSLATDGIVKVTAIDAGDRDYKSAKAEAEVEVSGAPAYLFQISVPSATYGDTGLKASIVLNEAQGANPVQSWVSSDPTIADIDQNGNITIYHAGSVDITCTQTTATEPSVDSTVTMVIQPKLLHVKVDDQSKYVGEALPIFTAQISQSELVGNDAVGQPIFSCLDIKQTPVNAQTPKGTYDIEGAYASGDYPDYRIEVQKGILTIAQDEASNTWYHLETKDSGIIITNAEWVSEDVSIMLDAAQGVQYAYDEISIDTQTWDHIAQIVSQEGAQNVDVYFRYSGTQAISTPHPAHIRIDKTKPQITSITGTKADRNLLEELVHTLTMGKYFKPNINVEVKAEDIQAANVNAVSGIKSITYEAYSLAADGTLGDMVKQGELTAATSFTLEEQGMYLVCAIAHDQAGNASDEECSGIRIHKMGESSDDKELPDINIDIDGDGFPDINITRPNEKYPYLNIDSDGDGIPDINLSKKGEPIIPGTTEPYLNIVSSATKWNPQTEIDIDHDGIPDFRTDTSLIPILSLDSNGDEIPDLNIDLDGDDIPDINIDADGNGIPETNIDSDGDLEPDINIDRTGTGIPTDRICSTIVWDPTFMVQKDGEILYGTTSGLKPDTVDELIDKGIVVVPKDDSVEFLPNYAIKVTDVTKDTSESEKKKLQDIMKEKEEIKQVLDVRLTDGEKEIQPDGSILVRIPMDETIQNPRLFIKNAKGVYEQLQVEAKDGYYEFAVEYLGQISIVGEKAEVSEPNPKPTPEPAPNPEPEPTPNKDTGASVQGSYISSQHGMGGAMTGDATSLASYGSYIIGSSVVLLGIYARRRRAK